MAFKKLDGIDGSDMHRWSTSACASAFMDEIADRRRVALGALIKKPTEENAAVVRAYDRVERLMDEARKM